MKFNNSKELLAYIVNDERDLYSPSKEVYVFSYNSLGSICVYTDIDEDEAKELDSHGEYWGAYLGAGGRIYDSEEYAREHGYVDDVFLNIDWCNRMSDVDDWIDVTK